MDQQTLQPANSVVVDVVEAVATAAGTDALSLEPQLNDVIDPDALERLVDSDTLSHVTFEYEGHAVTVSGDGTVTVDDGAHGAAVATAVSDDAPMEGC